MMTSSKVYNAQPIYDSLRGPPKAPEQPQHATPVITNPDDPIALEPFYGAGGSASVAPEAVPSDMQLVLDTFAKMEFDFNILKEAVRKVTNGDFNVDQLTAVYELIK